MNSKTTLENVYVYSGTTPINVTFPLTGSLGDFFCIYAENSGKWRILLAFNQKEPGDMMFSKPGVSGWILRSICGISTITYYPINGAPNTVNLSGSFQI